MVVYAIIGFSLSLQIPVVGLTGLEPVTLRLSSACSNQLSYRPKIISRAAFRCTMCAAIRPPNHSGSLSNWWRLGGSNP